MRQFLIIFIYCVSLVLSNELDDRYEQILAEAEFYLQEKNINATTIKLQKLEANYSNLDFRFYKVLGDLFLLEERKQDALVAYTQSLQHNPSQPQVAKLVYKFYLENREIQKAFDILRIYLSNEKADLDARFDSLILAARLGNKKYYQFALKRIQTASKNENEKELLDKLKLLESKKSWKELEDLSFFAIKHFPENRIFYRYALLALNKQKYHPEKLEFLLISQTAVFSEARDSLELAQFYEKQNRTLEALNLYRITFSRALQKKGLQFEEEVLVLLRNLYYSMGWKKEALETSELIDILRMKNIAISNLENRIRVMKNREFLVSLAFLTKDFDKEKYQYYKTLLKQRDEQNWNKDFFGVFPIFYYEEYIE